MGLIRDARGQSVVIGSLLIFTVLILAFSGYQAFAVPDQNAEVEVDHFQENEDRFSEFRSNIVIAVGTEETRSTVFDLGARYPSRIAALNPPPAAGRLETTNSGNVSIEESGGSVDDLCSESGTDPTTRSLVYTPSYNEYREARAIGHESRVISREYDGSTIYDQRLVRGNNIDLVLLNGTVSENGLDAYSLEIDGSNRNTRTLDDPNVTIPSRFNATTWNGEILDAQPNVTATNDGDRVELNFTGPHDVSCAVVGLDGDPRFTPPDDGGGSGGGDDGGAYDVRWLDPTSKPETSSCSDTECTLDASESQKLDLIAETMPPAQDATVDFSVSDGDIATITPSSDDTGSDGKVSARIRAQSNGDVKVYTASGGSGDVINVTIENCPPGCSTGDAVVYTRGEQKISTVNQSENPTDIEQKGKVIGPLVTDIDGDGDNDIPYVNESNSKVYITDPDGSDVTELSLKKASGQKSLLGVGKWNGSTQTSVYFAGDGQSKIYRTNPSEGDVEVVNPDNGVGAVAGPADIDGDGTNELVYTDGSQALRYFEPGPKPDSPTGTLIYDDVGSSKGIGLGRPADFDGNGTARIPVVNGSPELILVDSNGDETVLVPDGEDFEVAKSPVATVDWDSDGELEIVYLTKNNGLMYVDNVTESNQTVKDTGIDKPRTETGVA